MFCQKAVLKNFAKITGKHLCQSLFVNKVKKEAQSQVFLCETHEFFKNLRTAFFERTPPVDAS